MKISVKMSGVTSLILLIVQLIFIVLKLTDKVDWSWFVVLLPLWLPVVFAIVALIVVIFIYVLFFDNNKGRRK